MKDYWVWCGSVIKGEDKRYHMFASRWPKYLTMSPHWLLNSEIVRASSDKPEGPYKFEEVVFEKRDRKYFDGLVTHNPAIRKHGDTYLLYYLGVTYEGQIPDKSYQERDWSPRCDEIYHNKRIGLATSKSIFGPWERKDNPILLPREDNWDRIMTTNPAPCVMPDGSVYLVYKSRTVMKNGVFHLGLAHAKHFNGPYERLKDQPLFDLNVEDPFLWYQDKKFHIIMKDMSGKITGENHAGVYATSKDCLNWSLAKPPKAYSRTVLWDNGTTTHQGAFERPHLLMENHKPTHLFAATGDGPGGFWNSKNTWNMVTPLKL